MRGMQLISVGGVLPEKTVTNFDLEKIVDTNDQWIVSRTGIRERHFCDGDETVEDLAVKASRMALERSGLKAEDIGVVVCGTVSSPYGAPSLACIIQSELGIREDVPCLDINAACTGFMYGVEVAHGLLNTLGGKYALVIGAEQLSKLMDMTDRNTCVLFGDGAGAGVFELCQDENYAASLGARGSKVLISPGYNMKDMYIHMDGTAVFRFAVEAIPKCIDMVLKKSGMTLADVDHVVCHQANERIIDHCIKKLKAREGLFFKNLDHTGNTSAASIPLALNEMYEMGILKPGQKALCVGFGGGLTWAGVLLNFVGGKNEAS